MKTKLSPLAKKIRKEAVISLRAEPEDCGVRGNALASGDDAVDKAMEDKIINDLNDGNEWAWCTAAVRATWNALEATDYLGCCSYESAEDFKRPGGYYQQMVDTVIDELVKQAETIRRA